MKVDTGLQYSPANRAAVAQTATLAAEVGFDRLFSHETANDPFLPIALAAGVTDLELGTNIAVAFARNPMTTAMSARDLHELTGGRFILGLGSQVKAHITRRFSMPWSHPAARMREFLLAVRAIWDSWQNGSRLKFDGEFYQHTLSSPLFDPGPCSYGVPKIFLAAVGPLMTETAGEVADGLFCHGFTSPSYMAEVTLPALRRGLARAGRDESEIDVSVPVFLATGATGDDLADEIARVRKQVAFYGSTPTYRGVLEHHGWGYLHEELHQLSVAQRWDDMTALIDDEVLNTLAVVAEADKLADSLLDRYGNLVSALRINVPYADDPDTWAPVIARLKQ